MQNKIDLTAGLKKLPAFPVCAYIQMTALKQALHKKQKFCAQRRKEITKMETSRIEMSLNELEQVNGGNKAIDTACIAGTGAIVGGPSVGVIGICIGLASGPVGWLALAGAAVCGAAAGTAYALLSD